MRLINADELVIDARLGEEEIPYISAKQINEAPTIDAEPVRHGQWMWYGDVDRLGRSTGRHFGRCSRCGFKTQLFLHMPEVGLNWCGECGAKMDE